MFFSKRSMELELIDLGPSHYSSEEYRDCLDKLNKVGKYLGGDHASFCAMQQLSFSPASVLDVGCGGGGFTQKLGRFYKEATVRGIDISHEAIISAQEHNRCPNVVFECRNLSEIPTKSYDIVISTLVCHHLSDADLIAFLKECLRVAKQKVIVNDLHRHPLAWLGFSLLAPILFKNRLITHDGSLSVKRAFKRKDWRYYLQVLQVQGHLSWYWPFRWILTMDAQ
ncbi:putative uncharacterized protein [Parachlamydia acanthamoebae UV-7]|uniref:Methyltransferase domain-containing protein n=2 Tax=Parachlamydia acanthamoebae TaxID=83552 RepID=F8KZX8_PARAV|nr:methyltransferase domain-containing protein [Parachlamydia acanthamoebae]CCB86487.1 putative uncharacterized protein [Parachlamydia acanthamoebae UV-7]